MDRAQLGRAHFRLWRSCSRMAAVRPQLFFTQRSAPRLGGVGAGQVPVSSQVAKVTFLTASWSQRGKSLCMLAASPG